MIQFDDSWISVYFCIAMFYGHFCFIYGAMRLVRFGFRKALKDSGAAL